jgi:hypothetical protein
MQSAMAFKAVASGLNQQRVNAPTLAAA